MKAHALVHVVATGMKGQLPGITALGGHDIHVVVAVVLAGKSDPLAVGREFREIIPGRDGW